LTQTPVAEATTTMTTTTTTTSTLTNIQYEDPLSVFLYALKAPETKRQYPRRLKVFLDFLKLQGPIEQQSIQFLTLVKQNPQWLQSSLMQFISFQKERARKGEISHSTINNYYKATKLFIDMNVDTPIINWKKVSRGIPTGKRAANDRAPTAEELLKLSQYPDRRIKPIIYIMASSGIRLGAWDYLQWKHVGPMINEKGEIVAAKLTVYADESDQYYCFITPAAYIALKEWMDYRKLHGEEIAGESWLMRDLWQTTDTNYGAKFGLATIPKKLKSSGIKSLIERAIRAQGLFKPLPPGVCRREWKGVHGMRKFYKTHAEQVMKPINVEITMGHDIGVSASYYKPTENEVLEDYLKAVDLLTINGNSKLLQKQVRDKEVMNLKEQVAAMQESHKEILDLLRDPIRLAELVKAH
jgi:site-specific recombinase XerC